MYLVTRTIPGSQAEQLGIRAGDVIETYTGIRVTSSEQLRGLQDAFVAAGKPKAIVTINRAFPSEGRRLQVKAVSGKLGVYCGTMPRTAARRVARSLVLGGPAIAVLTAAESVAGFGKYIEKREFRAGHKDKFYTYLQYGNVDHGRNFQTAIRVFILQGNKVVLDKSYTATPGLFEEGHTDPWRCWWVPHDISTLSRGKYTLVAIVTDLIARESATASAEFEVR